MSGAYAVVAGTSFTLGLAAVALSLAWPGKRAVRLVSHGAWGLALWAVLWLWVLRWVEAQHVPFFGTYETATSLAAIVLLTAMVATWRWSLEPLVGGLAALIAGAVLFQSAGFDATVRALTISERSWVLQLHAWVSWIAFGVLTVQAGLSLFGVVRPDDSPRFRAILTTTLHWGFVGHTVMIITGIWYQFLLFGRAWSFDPIETLAVVAWLAYGALLHVKIFTRVPVRKAAAWSLFVFVVLLASYRAIVYFPSTATYHVFDVDIRMHKVN